MDFIRECFILNVFIFPVCRLSVLNAAQCSNKLRLIITIIYMIIYLFDLIQGNTCADRENDVKVG